jgi:hypothetical protein
MVGHKLVGHFGFDYDVIHISLNSFTDELSKTLEHTPLVCSPLAPMFFSPNDIVTQQNNQNEVTKEVTSWLDSIMI